MELKRYIETFPFMRRMAIRQQLAEQAGVGLATIGHWLAGIRRVPAERAVRLEQATGGVLTRESCDRICFSKTTIMGKQLMHFIV
jgi:DNA-binding transcriptional regulator YdaS (Cro superfamily)